MFPAWLRFGVALRRAGRFGIRCPASDEAPWEGMRHVVPSLSEESGF